MADIVRVRRRLESETLRVPEAREFIGHEVEIVIRDVGPGTDSPPANPLAGSVLRYDDPFEPVAEE